MNKLLSLLFTCIPLLSVSHVNAEDGVTKSRIVIGQNITLQGGKNDYGMAVMAGMETYFSGINKRGGINGRQIVLKTLDDDNKSDKAEANARQLVEKDKVFILYGSIEGGPSNAVMKAAIDLKVPFFDPLAGAPTLRRPHQPLVFPVRAEHREEFRVLMAQAKSLGPLAEGIVFSQVVPSPWEKKTAITREYQEEFTRLKPGQDFSYGSLEGYITAKALVLALRLAGPNLTRDSFIAALNNATLDINGLKAKYAENNHQGLSFVDLSIVNHEGKFRH